MSTANRESIVCGRVLGRSAAVGGGAWGTEGRALTQSIADSAHENGGLRPTCGGFWSGLPRRRGARGPGKRPQGLGKRPFSRTTKGTSQALKSTRPSSARSQARLKRPAGLMENPEPGRSSSAGGAAQSPRSRPVMTASLAVRQRPCARRTDCAGRTAAVRAALLRARPAARARLHKPLVVALLRASLAVLRRRRHRRGAHLALRRLGDRRADDAPQPAVGSRLALRVRRPRRRPAAEQRLHRGVEGGGALQRLPPCAPLRRVRRLRLRGGGPRRGFGRTPRAQRLAPERRPRRRQQQRGGGGGAQPVALSLGGPRTRGRCVAQELRRGADQAAAAAGVPRRRRRAPSPCAAAAAVDHGRA